MPQPLTIEVIDSREQVEQTETDNDNETETDA